MMVGRWVSFWDCRFLGAMLNFWGVTDLLEMCFSVRPLVLCLLACWPGPSLEATEGGETVCFGVCFFSFKFWVEYIVCFQIGLMLQDGWMPLLWGDYPKKCTWFLFEEKIAKKAARSKDREKEHKKNPPAECHPSPRNRALSRDYELPWSLPLRVVASGGYTWISMGLTQPNFGHDDQLCLNGLYHISIYLHFSKTRP